MTEDSKLRQLSDFLYEDFTSPEYCSIFDGAEEALKNLTNSGITLAVLSNFDERLPTILKTLNLHDCFDHVFCSGVCGHAKPDREMFELVLKRYNVAASSCLHVGDDLELDYLAARRAGMNALLVNQKDGVVSKGLEQRHHLKTLDGIHKLIR